MHDLQLITVDDNTCITTKGKPITNVGANNIMSGDDNTFCTKKFLAPVSHKE